MADRKAVNKYYPPEWEPKHGSINKFRGQHPLRDRARKLDQGILIVRFEMPFNVWCENCDAHIGKGVRYNAEKKQAGNYFSTKIWSFRMKCHLCSSWMEIQTDPENRDYKTVSGVKKKTETYEDPEAHVIRSTNDDKEDLNDPFARLEHKTKDKNIAEKKKPELLRLIELNESKRDDFALSQLMRADNRKKKKEQKELEQESKSKGLNLVTLLPTNEEDYINAKQVSFNNNKPSIYDKTKETKLKSRNSLLFESQTLSSTKERKRAKLNTIAKAKNSKMDITRLQSNRLSLFPAISTKNVNKQKTSPFPLVAKR